MADPPTPDRRPGRGRWLDAVHVVVFLAGVIGFHEVRMAWGWLAAIGEALVLYAVLRWLSRLRQVE